MAAPFVEGVSEVHILDRLGTVFRHLKLVLAVFSCIVAIGALQSFSTVPRYKARATVLIQDERSVAVNLNPNTAPYYEDSEPYYNTQYSILRGKSVGLRVVKRLNLVERGLPAAPPRGPLASLSELRIRAVDAVLGRKKDETPGPPPTPADIESATVAAFLSGVEIIPIKTTRLVEVTYDSTSAEFAATAVNTLVEEYIQQNLDHRLRDVESNLTFLSQQLHEQQEKLEEAERKMTVYRKDKDAMSLGSSNIIGAQLAQYNDALSRAKMARIEKQAQYDQVKDANPSGGELENYSIVANNSGVQQLKTRLTSLEAERAKNANRWGPAHPEMTKLNAEIEKVKQDLLREQANVIDGIRRDYNAAVANERSLAAALQEQTNKAMQLDEKSTSYTVLERGAQSEREVYQALLQQEKALRVVRNSRANNIQLMDRAEIPKGPYVPDHKRDLLMSIVLGVALAFGLAFGIEYLDDTIKTPEDVTRRLKLPLLGLIPAVRGDRSPILDREAPHDFGEAFRSLRTSLVFSYAGQGTRVIGVTSTQPLEGKTMAACNIAMVLAYGGARVLLIDGDLRRPGLHRPLGIKNEIGLSHLLTGQARLREVVRPTSDPNLMVMTAGRTPPNPSELLASERMQKLLQNLRSGPFDWVIIDTPPVLAVTDAVILAPQLTGFAFVIGAEMTRRAHAERAVQTLLGANPASVAVILNRVDFERNKYYYSRYYGYQYKNYYA